MSDQARGVDTSKPHAARIYDYFLGGENHFPADRTAAAEVLKNSPSVRVAARENRAFLGRAVRYLAAEAGIRQFLDIGSGLPTADNVHNVAQASAPSARVVYVDNDPLVLLHARELLASAPQAAPPTSTADLRDPAAILSDPVTRDVLDFGRPVGLIMAAILHFVADEENPRQIIAHPARRAAARQLPGRLPSDDETRPGRRPGADSRRCGGPGYPCGSGFRRVRGARVPRP